jgi:hypothetical protein
MNILLFAIGPFLGVGLVLLMSYLLARGRCCPDCGEALSAFLSPSEKSWRQWVEGGYRCRNCGCETNMSGNKVPEGTPPKTSSVVGGALLLFFVFAAPIVPPLVLLIVS